MIEEDRQDSSSSSFDEDKQLDSVITVTSEGFEKLSFDSVDSAETSSHHRNGSAVDEAKLSLAARRALAAEKVLKVKQDRLAEFVKRNPLDRQSPTKSGFPEVFSASSSDSTNSRSSITERFEVAKAAQQKIEEERLARIKGGNSDQARHQPERKTSLKNVWADALHESKNTEQSRVQLTRNSNTQQIRWLDGSGIVKAKIGEWEELFMQIAATMDQLEDTLIAAQMRYQSYEMLRATLSAAQVQEEQRKFRESANVPERFILGETHIYNSRYLENQVHTYLKHSLSDSRTRHIALSCGVYGEHANKPQIDVFAAAIKTDDNSMYVALTVKPSRTCEDEKNCYGIYKVRHYYPDVRKFVLSSTDIIDDQPYEQVAVFSKDVGQRLLERIIDVTPGNSWNESKSPDPAYMNSPYNLNLSLTYSSMDVSEISSSASDEGDGTWRYLSTPPISPVHSTMQGGSNSWEGIRPRTSSGFEDAESVEIARRNSISGNEEEEGEFHYGRALSVAHVGAARSFQPNLQRKEALEYAWAGNDEIDEGLPNAQQINLEYDIRDVQAFYAASNCFILAGVKRTNIFTGTLKVANTTNKYMIEGDMIFEWMRGPAVSGWLTKWPMKSQSFGTRTRRFFVLRDHILSYYARKPLNEEEVLANYSPNSLHLTPTSTIELGSHFFFKCMIVNTPLDTLHIRAASDEDEMRWFYEIKKSIEQQSRCKLFLSKPRIESVWYHEAENFSLISIDAIAHGSTYVKTALFCYAKTPFYKRMNELGNEIAQRKSAKSVTGNDGAAFLRDTYSVDIGSSETERAQLEVLLWDQSPLIPSDLKCVKIYGDMLILGGSKGYLAVGFIRPIPPKETPTDPKATVEPDPTADKESAATTTPLALYCVSCNPSIGNTIATLNIGGGIAFESSRPHSYPHDSTSTIICITSGNKLGYFFVADDKRNISVWALRKKSSMARALSMKSAPPKPHDTAALIPSPAFMHSHMNLSKVDPTGAYRDERIRAMKLILGNKYLLVSTSNRLLLFAFTVPSTSVESPPVLGVAIPETPIAPRSPNPLDSSISVDAGMLTPGGESFISGNNMLSPVLDDSKNSPRLSSWVELDRGIPGVEGVFTMFVAEKFVPVKPGSAMSEIKRKYIQWRLTSSVLTQISQSQSSSKEEASFNPKPRSSFSRSFSFSRAVPASSSDDPDTKGSKDSKRCTLYRFEWTEEMFQSALKKMKLL